jgi:pentatricopeptide repeat domain-containing protein 1
MCLKVSYNTVMAGLKKGSQWKKSLELMEEMQGDGVLPDLVTFNTVMDVCGKAGKWHRATELLNDMLGRGMKPDVVSYNTVMDACGKAGEYLRALELFALMEEMGVAPDLVSFNTAMDACNRALKWETALQVKNTPPSRVSDPFPSPQSLLPRPSLSSPPSNCPLPVLCPRSWVRWRTAPWCPT